MHSTDRRRRHCRQNGRFVFFVFENNFRCGWLAVFVRRVIASIINLIVAVINILVFGKTVARRNFRCARFDFDFHVLISIFYSLDFMDLEYSTGT